MRIDNTSFGSLYHNQYVTYCTDLLPNSSPLCIQYRIDISDSDSDSPSTILNIQARMNVEYLV